ncbi:MAG: TatD family hydrolase [Clostridia bacterium]|nr:TatD family hydrolase [Clostridia bacterium]
MLFDSHAHLEDDRFSSDLEDVIKDILEWGVSNVINVGSDIATSKKSVSIAQAYDFIFAAVGIHPHEVADMRDQDMLTLQKMASEQKVVAIGEIGLDYYYDLSPRQVQKERFVEQLNLAKDLNMPFIIHDRDAHQDILNILRQNRPFPSGGVMHCYSADWEMAKEVLDMGLYISFTGTITFKKAGDLPEVVKKMPIQRMLIETDCPYLAPVPYRGKRNFPGYVKYVAQKIAELRDMDFEEVACITSDNAKKLFGINK